MNNPWEVSVEDTPGTPIPGWAKMSSTDSVTTFLAFTAEKKEAQKMCYIVVSICWQMVWQIKYCTGNYFALDNMNTLLVRYWIQFVLQRVQGQKYQK